MAESISRLSARQLQVAELAAGGYSNREIASELKLTEQIVKNVLHSVFDKLGVWNRVEMANRLLRSFDHGVTAERQCRIEPESSAQLRLATKTVRSFNQPTLDAASGMELRDLLEDAEFPFRKKRVRKDIYVTEAYRTLARVFAESPEAIFQNLVKAATTFCGADSAGISLEEGNCGDGEPKFRWIAVSGTFAPFLNGTTPRFFSPCGTTLNRGRAQLYRVNTAYYDYLGIKADPITDGILIPWQTSGMRGTIWAVSHRHREAFDIEDFKLIDGLADFAAIAIENRVRAEGLHKEENQPAGGAVVAHRSSLLPELQSRIGTINRRIK